MAKYDPLRDWLRARADRYQAWWANEVGGNHVQAHAWLDAGWCVDLVDQRARWVRFRRIS
jgi:hypothetical protein